MTQAKSADHTTVQSKVEVVEYDRAVIDEADASGLALVETRLKERFSGALEGVGVAKHLRLERKDGSGTLICYERISASLDGRHGSFLLEASGFMEASHYVHGRWEIVPGSGTQDLQHIRGYAAFMARRDERSKSGWAAETALTYWFDNA
jgi:Protein of unknown function (DUF3224)